MRSGSAHARLGTVRLRRVGRRSRWRVNGSKPWSKAQLADLQRLDNERLDNERLERHEPLLRVYAALRTEQLRGRAVQDVVAVLRRELGNQGLAWPEAMIEEYAHNRSDPWWPLRHPRRARKEQANSQRSAEQQRWHVSPGDPADPFSRALFEVEGVRGWALAMFVPNAIDVDLHRYSEEAAETIRRICAPRIVCYVLRATPGRGKRNH